MNRSTLLTRDRPLLIGLVPAIPIGLLVWSVVRDHTNWLYPAAFGGIATGMSYLTVTFVTVPWTNPDQTERHATTHKGWSRFITELILLIACLLSIGGVFHLFAAGHAGGSEKPIAAGIGVACILVAWVTVHTVFSLRYAHEYYRTTTADNESSDSPIEFDGGKPAYLEFFYTGLTVGMAYAVSDTSLRTRRVRGTAILHALLSYIFGVVVLGSAVNLVVSLGNTG
jgi:uncharacterized membrane protein